MNYKIIRSNLFIARHGEWVFIHYCCVGLDTDIFNGHGHSQFFMSRTRTCRYEACPQTDTETDILNFSYHGHGHCTLCVSEYGHGHGHVAHYVFLYGHGHVSLFRVCNPRTFTKYTTFTHRNSFLLPAKRQIQVDVKASTVVPNKSTSLARRA